MGGGAYVRAIKLLVNILNSSLIIIFLLLIIRFDDLPIISIGPYKTDLSP